MSVIKVPDMALKAVEAAPSPRPGITESEWQERRNEIVRNSLSPVAGGLGMIYTVLAISHIVGLQERVMPVILVVSGGAILMLGMSIILRRWPIPARWTHPVASLIIGLLLAGTLLNFSFLAEPQPPNNLLLLIVSVGFFMLSTPWLISALAVIIMGWIGVTWLVHSSYDWKHFIFVLFSATVLSVLIHRIHVKILAKLEQLRLQDKQHQTALKAAHDELELRVKQRTDELEKINASLRREIVERERLEEALHQSETRKAAMFQAALDAIVTMDHEGKILEFNPAAEKIFGYTHAEALGKPMAELLIPPAWREKHHEGLVIHLASGKREIIGRRIEQTAMRADGTVFPIELAICQIPTTGHPNFTAFIHDITERRKVEAARRESEERIRQQTEELERLVEERTAQIKVLERHRSAAESFAAIGQMTASIAHEINNPLAAIKNSFHLVSRAVPPDHRHYHYVEKIDREIDRIGKIVHQMLALYRTDRQVGQVLPIDKLLQEVVDMMQSNGSQQHVKIELEKKRASTSVCLPENSLRPILYSLIQNAIEASPQGGVVRVRSTLEQKSIMITVTDQGDGIPEEISAHIFEPLFTTKGESPQGGVGLGLAFCKSLIETMNGTITFDSKLGEGTEFRVVFPLNGRNSLTPA